MTDGQTETAEAKVAGESHTPLQRFTKLEHRKRALETELDDVKKAQVSVAEVLLDEWADTGQSNAKIDGFNVHIRQDFKCNKRGGVPTAQVCEVLKTEGLGQLVAENYSPAALKSRVKELAKNDQVPESLQAVLWYDTIPRLIAVKV